MTNPYSPPAIDEIAETDDQRSDSDVRSFAIALTLIVCLNTPMPVYFSLFVTGGKIYLGMFVGLVAFWLGSLAVGIHVPTMRLVLTKGGAALALTQLVPVLQIIAGALGMFCCIEMGIAEDYSDNWPAGFLDTDASAFACTIIVAMILAGAAVIIGVIRSRDDVGREPLQSN